METPKQDKQDQPKRPVGRPPLKFPDLIPDTPENIARAVLTTKPKKRGEWRFEREKAQD